MLRRYRGYMADSSRWERFAHRPGDVVISTPAKSGTTWMQQIVGMLLFGRVDLGRPISELSPWLDMLIHTDDEVFRRLESQQHRRFIKTHTPLDGIPLHDDVTYLAVIRHPLDVALSDADHMANLDMDRAGQLRVAASGPPIGIPEISSPESDSPRDRLLWFIENDNPPVGSGPHGLADYCQQVGTYWERRTLPNVHLFHYDDLWRDRSDEMRRVAVALEVEIAEKRWPELVAAASLGSMRSRASVTAPEAEREIWTDSSRFFSKGGRRDWADHLTPSEIERFDQRLDQLAGPAADWVRRGRAALGDGISRPGRTSR